MVPQALCSCMLPMQEFRFGHAFGQIAPHLCIKDVLNLDAFLIKQRHRVISGVVNDLDH
jgi:hypothetical protein